MLEHLSKSKCWTKGAMALTVHMHCTTLQKRPGELAQGVNTAAPGPCCCWRLQGRPRRRPPGPHRQGRSAMGHAMPCAQLRLSMALSHTVRGAVAKAQSRCLVCCRCPEQAGHVSVVPKMQGCLQRGGLTCAGPAAVCGMPPVARAGQPALLAPPRSAFADQWKPGE